MTVETFPPLSASISWVLVFELAMSVKKKLNTWDFHLGVFWCMQVDCFLFFLPIVNVGVKQINEAFESSLFCTLSSYINELISNYNFSCNFMIGFTKHWRITNLWASFQFIFKTSCPIYSSSSFMNVNRHCSQRLCPPFHCY